MSGEPEPRKNPRLAALLSLASEAFAKDDVAAALHFTSEAVELDASDWTAQVALGHALSRNGQHEAASAACSKAVELNMSHYATWLALGVVGARAKLFQQAEKSMKSALELAHPGHAKAEVLTALGTLYSDSERVTEVEACFVQAINEGPQNIEPRAKLFMHLVAQRQLEKAASVGDALDELVKQRTAPLSQLERTQTTEVLALRDDIRRDLKKLAEYRASEPGRSQMMGIRFEAWASNWAVGRGILTACSFILRPFQR